MPRIKFPIQVGVFKDETPLSAEGYCVDTQGYRIHRNGWQTQRGYEKASSATFSGLVRGAAAWSSLASIKTAGFGTATALYLFYGGSITDVTPAKLRGTGTDIFTTESGSPVITVTIPNHGLKAEDTFNQTLADAVGGITLDASYSVTEILDINRFTITHGSNATSSAAGGGKCEYNAPLDAGLVHGTGGIGYGTGPFGAGLYGQTSVGDTEARRWAISSWGQNMLACAPGGPLYEQQPRISYPDLLDDITPTAGAGWSGAGPYTASSGSASDLDFDLTGKWSGGDTVVLEITATVTAGSFEIKATSATGPTTYTIGESIEESGTYERYFQVPPAPTTFAISKDSSFAGSVTLSLKVAEKAYRITSAPQYSNGVVVDANNHAIVWATVQSDGVYNRRCIRWSDLGDNKTWLKSATNLAGENSDFGVASEVIAVVVTKSENLVFTDAGVYTMQYVGEPDQVYDFDLISGGSGLMSPGAVAAADGRVVWLSSNKKFYIYQGNHAQEIECPVLEDMVDNLAVGQDAKISVTVQAKHSEFRISYADARDGNEVSRAVVFNWVANRWYNDTELRTERIGKSVFNELIGFGSDGYIYYQDIGTSANGDELSCSMETGAYDAADGDKLVTLKRFVPDFKKQTSIINLHVYVRNDPAQAWRLLSSHELRPDTKSVPLRGMCREFMLKFESLSASQSHRHGAHKLYIDATGADR